MDTNGGQPQAGEQADQAPKNLPPTTAVRYGKMGFVGEFTVPRDLKLNNGGRLIVSTDRGIEIGEHVPLTCEGCLNEVPREQMLAYAEACKDNDTYRLRAGRILREATDNDLAEFRHIVNTADDKLDVCRKFADELGLDMKIVDCEQILGGERIVFYFMAEERVDFRQLVRRLAEEFQTRIEMRQVGARDEARLLADYETCGRQCCCKNFLKTLKPVTMSMAKLQKTTLDLAKVSGRCGRLKCCLRYEHKTYEALSKALPRNNSWISTTQGVGKVVDRQILTQLVRIKPVEGPLLTVAVEDILETNLPAPPPELVKESAETSNGGRTQAPRGDYRPDESTWHELTESAGAADDDESDSADMTPGETDTDSAESRPNNGAKDGSGRPRKRRGRRGRHRNPKNRGQRPDGPAGNN